MPEALSIKILMTNKTHEMLFIVAIAFVSSIGAFWYGKSFKLAVLIVLIFAFIITWLMLKNRKDKIVQDLKNMDKESQDLYLNELDDDEMREEIRKKIGRKEA